MLRFAALLALLGAEALADDFVYFHSPSDNIHCVLMSGEYEGVRCDMRELTPSFTGRPADCELDWGDSFGIGPRDTKGYLICHGDTVISPGSMELGYGASAILGDFTCLSEKTGMTCTSARGHGFAISKARQELF
jgi:hypothetical protein